MKIVCISDTHNLHSEIVKIPEGDILIFAGDFMTCGYKKDEVVDFLRWFTKQPHKYKIMIAGNHDRYVENFPEEFKHELSYFPDIIYLENEHVTVEGLKIFGTPYTKHFGGWAFNRSETQLSALFDMIPENTDVLISHGPQHGVLDTLMDGRSAGELELTKKIRELKNLKLHVFGHIHDGFGIRKQLCEHISVNAAQVDETYEPKNFPLVVTI